MNTGIQDAHNLAWKLAFVINHNISDKLLDTYYAERAPVALQNIAWSTGNAVRFNEINHAIQSGDIKKLKFKLHEQNKNLNYNGLDLGFIYHSKAINSENNQTLSVTPSEYIPTTLPGSRAPHALLMRSGKLISTLDLFEKEYVLLIGSAGEQWKIFANELSQKLPFPLQVYKIADDGDLINPDNAWYNTYEITTNGAVLVRPDGHVAWRSITLKENHMADLERYFKNIA